MMDTDDAGWLDREAMRRSFDSAAGTYDEAAVLQREVCARLLERLDLIRLEPERVLDLGCGTGNSSRGLRDRYRRAQVIALDLAPAMLRRARRHGSWMRPLPVICGEGEALPLADHSVDMLFSNLALQWCQDLPRLFRECQRVLRPDGLLMFSTFGPDTLRELRQSWAVVDDAEHVSRFVDMHDIGDALAAERFADPVMDMERLTVTYPRFRDLAADLKALGAHNAHRGRPRGLTGRRRLDAMLAAYEGLRDADGRLPATWEVLYGHAWATDQRARSRGAGGAVTVSLDDVRRKLRAGP